MTPEPELLTAEQRSIYYSHGSPFQESASARPSGYSLDRLMHAIRGAEHTSDQKIADAWRVPVELVSALRNAEEVNHAGPTAGRYPEEEGWEEVMMPKRPSGTAAALARKLGPVVDREISKANESDPQHQLNQFAYRSFVLMNSIRDLGGIEKLTEKWSKEEKAKCLATLEKTLAACAELLEKLKGKKPRAKPAPKKPAAKKKGGKK